MARVGARDIERVHDSMSPGILAEIHAEERRRRDAQARKDKEKFGSGDSRDLSDTPIFENLIPIYRNGVIVDYIRR